MWHPMPGKSQSIRLENIVPGGFRSQYMLPYIHGVFLGRGVGSSPKRHKVTFNSKGFIHMGRTSHTCARCTSILEVLGGDRRKEQEGPRNGRG